MKKAKQNNIVKFPNTISDVEKEIEAVLFASSEPLTAESILEKITKKNTNVLKCLEKRSLTTYSKLLPLVLLLLLIISPLYNTNIKKNHKSNII